MSAALKIIGGLVLAVVGGIMSFYGIPGGIWVARAGTMLMLAGAAQALGPKAPRAPPLSGIDIAYTGTLEPRRLIYGKIKTSGMHALPPTTTGANNDDFQEIIVVAGRAVDSFGDIYLGQIRIPTANIAAVTGSSGDGLISGIPAPVTGTVNGQPFNNKVWLRGYTGAQTTVDFILNSVLTSWNASHVGRDIAYLANTFHYDQAVFSAGVPNVTAIVNGHRLYDPRLDSTNGGAGAQRTGTPSTWTYSTNNALVLRDFLTAALGLSEAQTRIDDTLVAAAANVCDQTVTVPIPVLIGLTNWTGGVATVTGLGTAFTTVLATGYYVKAPNGTMLIVGSVTSDVQFTLGAAYGGASIVDQVTQYAPSNTTTQVQRRYTCNTVLDCTARYEDNIATLAQSMMGHCIYSGGKWRMYAGTWPGNAFSLNEDDLVGSVAIQCTTPRKDLYNAVRGNFIDPQQNYQPAEFPPVLNPTFATQDGGETIYVETNFPCCSDRYEAQRNAILMSRQSRNRHVVTAQYGMSAFGVRVWDPGTVTIAEVGWINQTVRCTSWNFLAEGVIELTLQEAYSADWADPLSTDYAVTGINVGSIPGDYFPYPPTGLTATAFPGIILFQVVTPSQTVPGIIIELWEYTAASSWSSATKVAEGATNVFLLNRRDTVTRYYWVRTRVPNGFASVTFPAIGAGLPGVADFTQTGDIAIGAATATSTLYNAGVINTVNVVGTYINLITFTLTLIMPPYDCVVIVTAVATSIQVAGAAGDLSAVVGFSADGVTWSYSTSEALVASVAQTGAMQWQFNHLHTDTACDVAFAEHHITGPTTDGAHYSQMILQAEFIKR